jgi:hypothetical protein
MNRRSAQILAVAVGALTYAMASLMRTYVLHYLKGDLSGHWLGSINALWIYVNTLLSGFVAMLLYSRSVFLIGFCAGAAGELARGIAGLLSILHAVGWHEIVGFPLSYMLDLVFASLTSGVLGAAGAAVAVVTFQCRQENRGDVRS